MQPTSGALSNSLHCTADAGRKDKGLQVLLRGLSSSPIEGLDVPGSGQRIDKLIIILRQQTAFKTVSDVPWPAFNTCMLKPEPVGGEAGSDI